MSVFKGGNLYCAVRDWTVGDFDIMGFETYQDMIDFCEFNPDYTTFETSLFSLKDAKTVFEGQI